MPKRQTDRSDIWALRAVVQGTGHMPIGLLALSFCECLRSVKQSRRLNLSAEAGTAGVCMYVGSVHVAEWLGWQPTKGRTQVRYLLQPGQYLRRL